jgi:predicted DNA-binding transcriptional regulator YafY
MNFFECIERIERLDILIRLENTGTPKELSNRLNISERQIYRSIERMRNLGAEIVYSKYKQSYIYVKPVKFNFGFTLQDSKSSLMNV